MTDIDYAPDMSEVPVDNHILRVPTHAWNIYSSNVDEKTGDVTEIFVVRRYGWDAAFEEGTTRAKAAGRDLYMRYEEIS